MPSHQEISNFIWQVADLLRGPYRPPQYERVMLPLTVLRRFDCVLEKSKDRVVAEYKKLQAEGKPISDGQLNGLAGQRFHNHSDLSFARLKGDPDNIQLHLVEYIEGFSQNVRDIFYKFDFAKEIEKMEDANILYLVVTQFISIDLHPDEVDNIQMGLLFEDLIRRFNEQANETAGDYFTPRDVVHLLVDVLLAPDDDALSRPGIVRRVLDPTCGTGGMLAEVQRHVGAYNRDAHLYVFGQEFNPRAFAIAAADLLIKDSPQYRNSSIEFGDTLTHDQFEGKYFDYFIANPPYGVDWKRQHQYVKKEHENQGYSGRFGAGLPRVSDGSLLFLQHMLHKMEPYVPSQRQEGARLVVVFSGSPMFSGSAGSGESNIRKWIIEQDWLEAIIALPDQLFYNTTITTYVWVLTNRKHEDRRKKIQLVDARDYSVPLRRSLGSKRRDISYEHVQRIVKLYADFTENKHSRIFANDTFGYIRLTVERPLRLRFQLTLDRKARFLDTCPYLLDDVQAIDRIVGREVFSDWNAVWHTIQTILAEHGSKWRAPEIKLFRTLCTDRDSACAPVIAGQPKPLRGNLSKAERHAGWFTATDATTTGLFAATTTKMKVRYEADADLRDFENVPLSQDPGEFFTSEVLSHVPEAWLDLSKENNIGYEINFNRYFYEFKAPLPLIEVDKALQEVENEILTLLTN
jgi:type I restriction enzyme M protein